MQAVKSLGMADANLDMFGFDSSAMRQAEAMARIANRRQRQLSEQLAAVQGAAKRPEQARKLGVDVADPDAVRAKIAEIKQERDAWETWSTNPDLVAQIRQEAEAPGAAASGAKGAAPETADLVAGRSVQYAKASLLPSEALPAGMPVERVQAIADEFLRGLNVSEKTNLELAVRPNLSDFFGAGTDLGAPRSSGFFLPAIAGADRATERGRNTVGLVAAAFPAEAAGGRSAVERTLRHEILAHYGINLLPPEAKRALLDRLIASKNAPGLRTLAREVERQYGHESADMQAEELFARAAEQLREGVIPHVWDRTVSWLVAQLRKIGLLRGQVTRSEVNETLRAIAEGIRRGVAQRTFPTARDAQFSRALNWTDDLSPEVRSMAEKIGAEPKGWRERLAEMRSTLPTRLRAGLVDRYARLLELDRQRFGRDAADTHADVSAWVAAKMSRSAEGALEALFLHGRLYWDGGALNVRETRNGLAKALEPVAQAGELNRFWQWIIAHRSQRLMSEGRERLFTAAEIAAGLTLNNGTMADGKSRDAAYRQAFARYRSLQKSVLDVAEHSGLFDAAQRAQWEHDFYLPFYRVIDDAGAVRGPTSGGQMVRQKAFEKLKGGAEPLGDPLQNILRNWHHLIDAGLKNRAATLALETASHLGVAEKIHEAQADKHSVWVMQVGQKTHYSVRDPLTLEAVSALTAPALNSTLLTLFGGFKRALTLGATISPAFKARNLLRDSLNVLAVSGISRNVPNNVIQGYRAAQEGTATQAALLAGGGTFRFGSLREGDPHAAARAIAGWQPDTVLDSRQKIAGLIETLKKGFDAWQRFGDRLETANRAALYEQLRKAGKTHLQAALAARDTLDFAQSGAWPATRMLITMVPFLNARIQGLDVLYRQGVKPLARRLVSKASAGEKQQALRFAATSAAIALASIVLYLHYRDDEDFQAREQWDRDAYWWFKIGDQPWRIPKPFEVGALGTVAERLVEQIADPTATGKLFAERLRQILLQTFHFDPTPQALQPLLEVYANRDSFTRRPIENLAMERLSPELRSGPNTSAVGVGLSRAGLGTLGVSPVQIDHLVNGYLGWLGAQALSLGDRIARPLAQMPERPDRGARDLPLIGDFIQSFAPDGRSNRYTTEFYEKLKTTRQAAADLHLFERLGDAAGVRRQVAMQRRELAQSGAMEAGARLFSQLGQAERRIANDPTLSGTEKQARIDALRRRQTAMAQRLIAALP